jgi:hypothetical protein
LIQCDIPKSAVVGPRAAELLLLVKFNPAAVTPLNANPSNADEYVVPMPDILPPLVEKFILFDNELEPEPDDNVLLLDEDRLRPLKLASDEVVCCGNGCR